MAAKSLISYKNKIEDRIFTVRGAQVMLDQHLAELYGIETKRLNEQVKRNLSRFSRTIYVSINRR